MWKNFKHFNAQNLNGAIAMMYASILYQQSYNCRRQTAKVFWNLAYSIEPHLHRNYDDIDLI